MSQNSNSSTYRPNSYNQSISEPSHRTYVQSNTSNNNNNGSSLNQMPYAGGGGGGSGTTGSTTQEQHPNYSNSVNEYNNFNQNQQPSNSVYNNYRNFNNNNNSNHSKEHDKYWNDQRNSLSKSRNHIGGKKFLYLLSGLYLGLGRMGGNSFYKRGFNIF